MISSLVAPVIAHALLDVTLASAVLALAAAVVARVPGLDAGTRSRWWSAVAIVPLIAFVVALAEPLVVPARAQASVSTLAGGALLVDPLDTLNTAGTQTALESVAPEVGGVAVTGGTPSRPVSWIAIAVVLWFAVAAVRVGMVLLSVVRAHRLGACYASDAIAAAAPDAHTARVAVVVSDEITTAMAIGLTRRAVVVPTKLVATLSAVELRAVVLHEIAHLRRRDDWVYLSERLASAVLWCDPLVHVALRAAGTWRERARDADAASEAGARACATALWRSAAAVYGAPVELAAPAFFSRATLVDRVEALLRPGAQSTGRSIAALIALGFMTCAVDVAVGVRAPVYALPSGLTATGSMHTRRASFAAVKLLDGRVLVAGGLVANGNFIADAELYDPAHGVFVRTGSLTEARTSPSGTMLADGRVLVAGGWTTHGVTAVAELYDQAGGTFTRTGALHEARAGHTATLLRDGTVLVTGGAESNEASTARAEIYDPRRGTFAEITPMHEARATHTATLLGDGQVLIAGGLNGTTALRTTELYNPKTQRFIAGPPMLEARSKQGATLLADGSVLIAGGSSDSSWSGRLASTERYEPGPNRFVPAATMHAKRFKFPHGTARLANGDVLIAGGAEQVEVYEAGRDRFRTVGGEMDNARNFGAVVLLDDGSVLIAGGYASVNPLPTTATALRYRPS